ncbi:MAG TPA: DUF58 domain-containing protein [Solirubrobacterales bacterium]|nr:DUF58 domain-containing protein [Solirubrobacterales bacterium]
MAGAATVLRLGLALAAAGAIFAAPILTLPGVALALLVGGCTAWVRLSSRGVTARRRGVPARVTEGERFEIVIEGVSGRLPLLARIDDDAAAAPQRLRVMRPRTHFTVRLEGSFARRGRRRLAAPVLRIADPLGIAARTIATGTPGTILVLPRVEPLGGHPGEDGPALGRGSRGLGELAIGGGRESATDPEIDGIRPYRPGTKATRIYWPALARGAGLVERQIVAAGDAAPLIALDPSGAASKADLDRAARAAASLMAHLARVGGCEVLVAGSPRRIAVGPDPRAWTSALAALAVVEATDGPPRLSLGDLRTSVIWVAASPSARPPPGVAQGFIVTPRAPGEGPVGFAVAGCGGRALARGVPVEAAA